MEEIAATEVEDLVKDDEVQEEAPVDGMDQKYPTDTFDTFVWLKSTFSNYRLPRKYRLVSEKDALQKSIQSVRFTVMASAINTKMLNPNYPIMVTPDAHPDSFPDTEPFDYNSATYFLPMCSLLGVAIASIFLGQISDRVGRKRVLLVLAWISTVGSVVKYFISNTFWGFCITQLVFGFFLGNLPVGMAYIGDVYSSKKEKERELGILVSFYVIGNSGGGIIAILMNDSGLFAPLWVGAILLAFAALNTSWYMVEAGDAKLNEFIQMDKESEELARPESLDQKALFNIIAGAVADNFGSTALFPLCLSPLAIEQYLFDFIERDEYPIMTLEGYQWLSVMVAGMVVPSTMMTPYVFRKLGVAGTCVMGNILTAVVTAVLLLIGTGPATSAYFGLFVFVMYAGFPFTVFSQLTTGPMLDVIAPDDKIGYVQGLNNAAMNFGMAIAPWLFGLLADSAGTNIAIIVGIGVSCLAGAINMPLTCDSRFGRAKPSVPSSKRVLDGEDSEFVEKALAGEFVDLERLTEINVKRATEGKKVVVPRVKTYAEEKAHGLNDLRSHADEYFQQKIAVSDRVLSALNDSSATKSRVELCDVLNSAMYGDQETIDEATTELGQWIGEYLKDTGHNPHTNSVAIKQMIMAAMPPINEDQKYTPDNLESSLIRTRQLYRNYSEQQTSKPDQEWTFSNMLGSGNSAVFYS